MQGTPLISPIFGTAALKDTGLVEGTVPIRIAGGALVGPMAWSQIATTPTTLNGYGITDGVRSVGLSLPAQFTISDSPVTGTGTLTAVWASQTQSHVLAAPINGNGTPAFRALVATDIPTLNQNTTGTAANVTGIVAIANGGTGATTDATARTALGATTVGSNLFTLANPSDITFPRLNADNTVSALNASDFRTAIGAGSIATQNSNNVTITGGTIAGITDLAIADGGTGASTAENARTNLGAAPLASPTFTGTVTASGTTASTSTTTGALVVTGGLGVGDALFAGGTATAGKFAPTANTVAGNGMYLPAANTLAFSVNGVEGMRLTPEGNLLIGATTQGAATSGYVLGLQSGGTQTLLSIALQGQTLDTGGMVMGISTSEARITVRENIPFDIWTNNTARMRIAASGNVGIGTQSPATLLHVNGTIRYTNRPAAGTITAIGFDANGDLRSSSSSLRYKHDVEELEKGLNEVMQLRPVSFKFNGEARTNMGFIAEEVDELGLSDVMLYNEEKQPEGVIYANMVALLTKAIQEQQAQIEDLKNEVNLLKGT